MLLEISGRFFSFSSASRACEELRRDSEGAATSYSTLAALKRRLEDLEEEQEERGGSTPEVCVNISFNESQRIHRIAVQFSRS